MLKAARAPRRRARWERAVAASVPPLLHLAGALPAAWAEWGVAGLAMIQGVLAPRRLGRALRWAGSQPRGRRTRLRLALALLANRGRFLVLMTNRAFPSPRTFEERLRLDGLTHLDAALPRGGAILLGFHLGPSRAPLGLQLRGYRVAVAGRQGHATWISLPAAWDPARFPSEVAVTWRDGDHGTRGLALVELLGRLRAGELVFMTADGAEGREAFRVPLPGRDLIVRAGWFALRQRTGCPVLPVLTHMEGGTRVVTVHPPLPAVDPDPSRDGEACRAALAPLLEEYVRRFPEQCLALAFEPDQGSG